VRAIPLTLERAVPQQRMRDVAIMGGLLLWLAYTRVYWVLQSMHLGAPTCLFYYLTGHPCPFCGGTRSFAYMWEGDLTDSVRLYPLGPALFLGTILGVGGLGAGAITGHTWMPRLSTYQWKLLGVGAASAVLLSWILKVFVLGN